MVSVAWVEWRWFARVVIRAGLCVAAALVSSLCSAQASGVGFQMVVCAPSSGNDLMVNGATVSCGTDANGNPLVLQSAAQLVAVGAGSDSPVPGGEQVGLDMGAAVLFVMAAAYGVRVVRNLINSSSEG